MKDLLEYVLISSNFGLVNGCETAFNEYKVPIAIADESKKNLCLNLFNLIFFYTLSEFNTHIECNLTITIKKFLFS